MIHVIATIDVAPERRAEFLEAFARLTPQVRAEVGCLEYGATVDVPAGLSAQRMAGDGAVVVVEKWQSVAALQAHLDAPHMHAFRGETGAMVRGVSLLVLQPA